jgi:predicted secreted protein
MNEEFAMIRRGLLAAFATFAFLLPLAAGDVATFANLGFSPDSSWFMFGQYGIDTASSRPWAEMYIVDTKKNDFAPKGRLGRQFDRKLEPGQSPEGALFSLFSELSAQARSLKIDHLASGRLIYVLMDGQEVPQKLEFRDFKTEDSWLISINKSVAMGKDGVRSSFGLEITRTAKDGSLRRVTAGNPNLVREGVKDYVIRRVVVAPDERTVVIIIEKMMDVKSDQSVRYMVEAFKLPN